ncbi:23S rRNA m(5)U-1939 methyltransferase [Desulfacinum hydrothermale DSM 13146]|uniref:23S rRNA m(5)U-1939 methyltransferase n=1 Tax=Desulfacinum hydrothermale DSM 13146 TaxID=1121390 RepID=A0A1W1XBU1_9BACT|nr:23S rRNA (uracil(1939)-C(5))-methyltransferase RlmD [Desulfacinum hydrothermale]SMC21310.1 23S rRNA m(5)U-1939 methyltransferase [Desulfacinum hydrothermale DSM 13146]
MATLRKGTELDCSVDKLAFGGRAVARVDGFVVFLDRALPGQKVRARVVKKRKNYAEAVVLEVLEASPHQVEPLCTHFGVCGGCRWQDLDYGEQLAWKRRHVQECLEHLGDVLEAPVGEVVPSPRTECYRNKMEFTFSGYRWLSPEEIARKDETFDRSFALGLHVRGHFDRVFDIGDCRLQSPEAMDIVAAVRDFARGSGLPPYSIREHRGCWRFLVIREGKRTGQRLVHLITGDVPGAEEAVDSLGDFLRETFPHITTCIHSVNRTRAQVAQGDDERILWGPGVIEEQLGDLRFRISAQSFFQTNPMAAEHLYQTALDFAGLEGSETVWDLYCGTGSIALFVARHARKVAGFEVVESAIEDAYRNAALNDVDNCVFRVGDLKDVIRDPALRGPGVDLPDVVITDPPRAGMHPHVVQALLELAPQRIVAVSCNPATLARDLALLLPKYRVCRVQPFDLFPHTPHVECVVQLDRKSKA